jgi:hypothetical protein
MRDTNAPGTAKLGPGLGSIADTGPGQVKLLVGQIQRTIGDQTFVGPAAEFAKLDQLNNIADPMQGGFPAGDDYVKRMNELDTQQAAARAPLESQMSSIQAAFYSQYKYWPDSLFSSSSLSASEMETALNASTAGSALRTPYEQALFEAQVKVSRLEISIARIDERFAAKRATLPTWDQLWAALQSAKDQQMAVLKATTLEYAKQSPAGLGLTDRGEEMLRNGPTKSEQENDARIALGLSTNPESSTASLRLTPEGIKLANDQAKLAAKITAETDAAKQLKGCTTNDLQELSTAQDAARRVYSLAQSRHQQELNATDGDPARLQAYSDAMKAAEQALIQARDAYDKAVGNRRDIEQTVKDKYADDVKALDQKIAELLQRGKQDAKGAAVYHDVVDDVIWNKDDKKK